MLIQGAEIQRVLVARLNPGDDLLQSLAELVRQTRGYFRANRARMDYPRFRELGLPTGSGAVESAARYVVQLRMKRPGSRRSDEGAEAILCLGMSQKPEHTNNCSGIRGPLGRCYERTVMRAVEAAARGWW